MSDTCVHYFFLKIGYLHILTIWYGFTQDYGTFSYYQINDMNLDQLLGYY